MKTIRYRNLRVGQLIQKFDQRWCPVSGAFCTNLDDMERFGRTYRRLSRDSIARGKWRRPVSLTSGQKRTIVRVEMVKINAHRKSMGMEPIAA